MIAADIMTHSVVTVGAEATLAEAVRLMLHHHVSGLPVVDSFGRVVGILSEGDLLRRAETGTEAHPSWLKSFFHPDLLAESFIKAHARRVSDVMQPDVITAAETTPMEDIVTVMQAKHIRRVPILSGDALVGIVARSDLVRALGRMLQAHPAPLSDAGITEQLHTTLAATTWAPHDVTYSVNNGHVQLHGAVFKEVDRGAIRVAAENVPGVVSVADHMILIDQNTSLSFGADIPSMI